MQRLKQCLSLIIFSCTVIGHSIAAPDLLPSEATTLMLRAMSYAPAANRTTLTKPIISRMQTENLDEKERFLKAEAHFMNFEPEPARDGFMAFRDHDNNFGRVAWQRLMIIRINAFNMVDQIIDNDIPMYRKRFGIQAYDREGITYPLTQTARQLAQRGEPDRALDLIADEVKRHAAFDAPYSAYRLPGNFMTMAEKNGRADEFKALQKWVADGISNSLQKRISKNPQPQRNTYTLPGAMLGTLFEDQRHDYQRWTAEFLKLQAVLGDTNQ